MIKNKMSKAYAIVMYAVFAFTASSYASIVVIGLRSAV